MHYPSKDLFFRVWRGLTPLAPACFLLAMLVFSNACGSGEPAEANSQAEMPRQQMQAAETAESQTSPAQSIPPLGSKHSYPSKPASASSQPTPAPGKTTSGSGREINGRWLLRSANRDFTVELISDEQDVRGYVCPSNGTPVPIKIGVFSGDGFLFETRDGHGGWLWQGQVSPDGLKGQRENLQTGIVERFVARRPD